MTDATKIMRYSLRRHLLAGFSILGLTVGGVGGWAATTQLSGAVVAPGLVVVDSYVKKVQHPTGGVVGEIQVRDGDHVHAGDLLVRLDETITRANLGVITKSLDELAARQGRLEAERDGLKAIKTRSELQGRLSEPDIADLLAGEGRLFELRLAARNGLRAQLQERIGQLHEQIVGLQEQTSAKTEEVKLIQNELDGVRELWRKNLIPISRVTQLEREATRLKGERGQLVASVAQTKSRISETELQIIRIDQDLRSEVAKELREIQAKRAELLEKRIAAEDQLQRVDIRAPQAGVVHQLSVHTIGGVVSPTDILMLIVPEGDALAIEAKIAPQDIDQIRIGRRAILRLSAFNQRTTPELNGAVSLVSADITQDQKTGTSFYTVRLNVPDSEIKRLDGLKLVPGMPVESFIETGERTVMSYLTKPIEDQLRRAWRER